MKNKVPKLRFPEFSGEWEGKELSSIIKNLKAGVSVNSEDISIQNGEKGVLKTSCIFDGKFKLNENKKIIDSDIKRANLNPQKGKIIISRMNTPELVGALAYINDNYKNLFLPDRLWQTEFFNNEYDGKWLSYILNTPFYNQKIKDLATGTSNSMKNISKESFLKLKINTAKEAEQEKIANFLSSVDIKIEKLEKKKELLEKYKKGMMQKLFSQKLRFKDENGNDYPEWEEKRMGEILIKNSRKNKGNKISKVQSISNKSGFINQEELFQDRIIASMDKKNYYIIEKGMFAYNPSRIDVGSLAYKEENELVVISPLYISFKAIREKILDLFLLEWFDSYKFKQQMQKSFEGSVRNTLSYEALSKILILFPSLPEQEKIANFLSSIDRKIELIEEELEKNKEFKKGLLQQMFV